MRLDAIELDQTSKSSYRELVNTLDCIIPTSFPIECDDFERRAIEGFSSLKGQPSTMQKKMNKKKEKQTFNPKITVQVEKAVSR